MKSLLLNQETHKEPHAYPIVTSLNEDTEIIYHEGFNPQVIIMMKKNYHDTDVIALRAKNNCDSVGDITWTVDLPQDAAIIENNAILRFLKHYEGSVTLTASSENATRDFVFTTDCEEIATSTTYSVSSVKIKETTPLPYSATSATVLFTGVTTEHYPLKSDMSVNVPSSVTVTFAANTSTSSTVVRSGTVKWNDVDVNWSVTLNKAPNLFFVDTNGQWRISPTVSISGYRVYESYSNYNVNSANAHMKITFNGLTNFNFYINSYAESSYDYTIAWNADTDYASSPSSSSSGVKAHTQSKQYSPTSISNYTNVSYTTTTYTHYIWVTYRKDSSEHANLDRGFIAIPNSFFN